MYKTDNESAHRHKAHAKFATSEEERREKQNRRQVRQRVNNADRDVQRHSTDMQQVDTATLNITTSNSANRPRKATVAARTNHLNSALPHQRRHINQRYSTPSQTTALHLTLSLHRKQLIRHTSESVQLTASSTLYPTFDCTQTHGLIHIPCTNTLASYWYLIH